jgi:hypothetical protein
LTALGQTIGSIKSQLDLLNGREEDIRTARGIEQVNYSHRTQNNNKVLDALEQVLKKLTQAVFDEKDRQGTALIQTERDTIVEEIRRELGYNNPIAIMVALTSKFDVGTVTRIIEKLETIRDGIVESQQEEDGREVNAASNFQSVIAEITDVRTKLASDFSAAVATQKKRTNEKVKIIYDCRSSKRELLRSSTAISKPLKAFSRTPELKEINSKLPTSQEETEGSKFIYIEEPERLRPSNPPTIWSPLTQTDSRLKEDFDIIHMSRLIDYNRTIYFSTDVPVNYPPITAKLMRP